MTLGLQLIFAPPFISLTIVFTMNKTEYSHPDERLYIIKINSKLHMYTATENDLTPTSHPHVSVYNPPSKPNCTFEING